MPVLNFFCGYKGTTNRQQTKNQLNFGRKRFWNRNAILWPSKDDWLHFLRAPIKYYVTSHKWSLVTSRQKWKNAQLSNTLFFFRKKFSKTWTPFITERNNNIGSYTLPKNTPEICSYPENVLRLQKNVKHDKYQNLIYYIFRVEASKVNVFFNNIRFCHTNPFCNIFLQQWRHIWPVISETRKQTDIKRNRIGKLKSVFLENNCFQSRESHQLSFNIRISANI